MLDVRYDRGVELPELNLWLDPRHSREFAFVSHAHSDHTGRHRETILTPETSALMAARMGAGEGIEHRLAYGERREFGKFAATLIPAGHVLGSAQILIEREGESLLYTGDFKLRPGLSSRAAEAVPADTLIMETTFGLPRYVFPPTDEILADVVRFCQECLADGDTPVLLGYSLGKAQEILSALASAGLPIMLHGAVAKITHIYESLGVAFPSYRPYKAGDTKGHVVICPPNINGSVMMKKIARRRVAALTGWAMDAGAIHRLRCDAVFPLSDHADYPDLLRHVEAVAPRRVLTLHGFAREFARDLRARGIEAWALTGADQLELRLAGIDPPRTRNQSSKTSKSPASATGFARFAHVCEDVGNTNSKLEKIRRVAAYLGELDAPDISRVVTWLTGSAFPQSSGRALHLGGALIRKALIVVSGVNPSEYQAVSRRFNDAGRTTREILAEQDAAGDWTLTRASEFFDLIASSRGPNAKLAHLESALREQSPATAMMLVKILTGDLRIGLKEGLVEDAIAETFGREPDAVRQAHMLTGDLGAVARHAHDDTLASVGVMPFRPLRPMLANPEPNAEAIWARLGAGGSVWVEDKLDGIRAQVHASDGHVEIFSRDLRAVTGTFPEIVAAAKRLDCVFDGEIVAFSGGRALGFFELQKRLGRTEADLFLQQDIPVEFHAFDLLWCRGDSLIHTPLAERRRVLETLDLPEPLRVAPVRIVESPDAIEAEFSAARDRRNEGLMVKDPASHYLPGRRGMAWIKFKKAAATLDVVVTSVEYGHGCRAGVLSDYTFSVLGDAGELLVIGKAYSGLTDAEIAALTPEFQKSTIRQRGRVFDVEPRVVLEIAFDSIQRSGRHASGLALRFPRIVRIRHDKTADAIDTLETALRLIPPA